jgi:hypothetical protein
LPRLELMEQLEHYPNVHGGRLARVTACVGRVWATWALLAVGAWLLHAWAPARGGGKRRRRARAAVHTDLRVCCCIPTARQLELDAAGRWARHSLTAARDDQGVSGSERQCSAPGQR